MNRHRREIAALDRSQDELESFASEIAVDPADPRCYYCNHPWRDCRCRCEDCGGSLMRECVCEPGTEANPRAVHHVMLRTAQGEAFTACAKPVTDKVPTDPVRVTCKTCRRWIQAAPRSPFRTRLYAKTVAQRQSAMPGAEVVPSAPAAGGRAARLAAKAATQAAREARAADLLRRQVPLFANPSGRRRRRR